MAQLSAPSFRDTTLRSKGAVRGRAVLWALALAFMFAAGSAGAERAPLLYTSVDGSSCIGPSIGPACPSYRRVVEHVLSRVAYGGNRDTRRRIYRSGLRVYLRRQLYPETLRNPDFAVQLEPYISGPYAIWGKSIPTLESQFCNMGASRCTDRISNTRHANANLAEVKFLRSVYSRRQLETVLLDFWQNHLNVDGAQRIARWAEQDYEQVSLRPHVLGHFEDLLLAMTKGIAMLDYLDLRRNREGNTNENFARELLELHSVGKVASFDEEDVQQVTLVLTGWTYNADREFVYLPGRHDESVKIVTLENTEPWVFDGSLGCDGQPPSAFENEGHVLLCLLALHPRTAERLSKKLIQRFVTEEPPALFIKRIAKVWLETRGDLRRVTAAILFSHEFLSLKYAGTKVKRPSVYAASLVRAIGAGSEGPSEIVDQPYSTANERNSFHGIMGDLDAMGERLYLAPPPTGYPEASAAWASAGGLLARMNLAERILRELREPATHFGIRPDAGSRTIVVRLEAQLAPGSLSRDTRQAIVEYVDALPRSADLDERVRQAARVLLAAPQFVQH